MPEAEDASDDCDAFRDGRFFQYMMPPPPPLVGSVEDLRGRSPSAPAPPPSVPGAGIQNSSPTAPVEGRIFDRKTKTPHFGGQVKYAWPLMVPALRPTAVSSCTPYRSFEDGFVACGPTYLFKRKKHCASLTLGVSEIRNSVGRRLCVRACMCVHARARAYRGNGTYLIVPLPNDCTITTSPTSYCAWCSRGDCGGSALPPPPAETAVADRGDEGDGEEGDLVERARRVSAAAMASNSTVGADTDRVAFVSTTSLAGNPFFLLLFFFDAAAAGLFPFPFGDLPAALLTLARVAPARVPASSATAVATLATAKLVPDKAMTSAYSDKAMTSVYSESRHVSIHGGVARRR